MAHSSRVTNLYFSGTVWRAVCYGVFTQVVCETRPDPQICDCASVPIPPPPPPPPFSLIPTSLRRPYPTLGSLHSRSVQAKAGEYRAVLTHRLLTLIIKIP